MKVTVCQFDPRPEYLKKSLNKLTAYVKEDYIRTVRSAGYSFGS